LIYGSLLNMKAYQRFRPLTLSAGLSLEPYQVTESEVLNALRTSVNDGVQNVMNFVDPSLKGQQQGHENNVSSVAFSPDGNTIASGSWDNTVKLWRRDGTLITTLKGHENDVRSVAFSPDGNTIASGSEDNTVKLWPVKLSDFFAMGCYWVKDKINAPDIQGLKQDCATVQSAIPPMLLIQARTTAEMGNYAAAQALLEDAKVRDPKLSIDQSLVSIRQTASQALLWQAQDRVSIDNPATLAADPKDINQKFNFLIQAHLEEANFLVRRAHSIDPNLNLNQELNQIKEQWKESVNQLKANSTDLKN
jgi:hypothetical protein